MSSATICLRLVSWIWIFWLINDLCELLYVGWIHTSFSIHYNSFSFSLDVIKLYGDFIKKWIVVSCARCNTDVVVNGRGAPILSNQTHIMFVCSLISRFSWMIISLWTLLLSWVFVWWWLVVHYHKLASHKENEYDSTLCTIPVSISTTTTKYFINYTLSFLLIV